jgi:hypothetical protein
MSKDVSRKNSRLTLIELARRQEDSDRRLAELAKDNCKLRGQLQQLNDLQQERFLWAHETFLEVYCRLDDIEKSLSGMRASLQRLDGVDGADNAALLARLAVTMDHVVASLKHSLRIHGQFRQFVSIAAALTAGLGKPVAERPGAMDRDLERLRELLSGVSNDDR